jgi:transketolase
MENSELVMEKKPIAQMEPAERKILLARLAKAARQIRVDIVTMIHAAKSGHPGGSLSATDLVAALYFHKLRHRVEQPDWPDRDRFILSKGHVCPLLYAALAESKYFPREELLTLRKTGSRLQGHPHRLKTPGVEMTSGSLGQGLSISNGLALALRLDHSPARVYCLIGDGESQEGQIWEAAMSAAHYKLDNVCGLYDYNHLQIDGFVEDVMDVAPVADKWRAFGWHVIEVDGHDLAQIVEAYDQAEGIKGKPTLILAHTVKGKGVSFMENIASWHGTAPNDEQLKQALKELEE